MSSNHELMEAVNRYNELDKEFQAVRIKVANLLREAAKTEQVTQISRLTKINRTTIYWLINTWSDINNGNNDSRSYSRKG